MFSVEFAEKSCKNFTPEKKTPLITVEQDASPKPLRQGNSGENAVSKEYFLNETLDEKFYQCGILEIS